MYGACRATAAFSSTSVPDLADFGTQLADDDELLDPCSANPEVALLAYSPLLSGAYTVPERAIPAKYLGPDTDAARRYAGGRTRRPRERQPGRPRLADGHDARPWAPAGRVSESANAPCRCRGRP